MVHLEMTKRIMIVMFTGMLMFSGLMLVNDWFVDRSAAAVPEFGASLVSGATTESELIVVSINITIGGALDSKTNNYTVLINYTIERAHTTDIVGENLNVTWQVDNYWKYNISLPDDELKDWVNITYDFSIWDNTNVTWDKTTTKTIKINDTTPPVANAGPDQLVEKGTWSISTGVEVVIT